MTKLIINLLKGSLFNLEDIVQKTKAKPRVKGNKINNY